jgi:uncharacterized protein YfdQ (DUF2303 family)
MAEIALSDKTLKEAVRLGQLIGEPKTATVNGIPFAVIPADAKVEDLTKFLYNQYGERPHRKVATVKVLDAASFIEYWTQFADDNSRAFADETKSTVLGVLDYHAAREGAPRWGDHRVQLMLRHSEEWKTWTGHNGQPRKMTQMEFAEFIEDNTPDIVNPRAADMLEMARTLQAKADVDFSSAIRTNNGQVQLKYTENVKGTYGAGNVEIPEEFTISIPVYVGSPRVTIRARLRYRLNSGKIAIWYDLLRADAVERDAFMATLEEIRTGIGVTVINGSPQ